ncbi:hypothetical protein H9P43_000808 [Blastocladiella emersonii ATCC 22665]|nr:hypothetical protein H9P43_000808 [Blastocladiella emersonii ATCC 22665]
MYRPPSSNNYRGRGARGGYHGYHSSSSRPDWESPPFMGSLAGRLIGPRAAHVRAVQDKFPGVHIMIEPLPGPSVIKGDSGADIEHPHVVRIYARPAALGSVDRAKRIFEAFLNQVNTAFPPKMRVFLAVPSGKSELQWDLIHDSDHIVGAIDTPPPYYRAVPADPHCLPLATVPISDVDQLAFGMANLSTHRFARHHQPIVVLDDGTRRSIATTLAKRRSELLAWAAARVPADCPTETVVKLKASLGDLVFSRVRMLGRMRVAAPDPLAPLGGPAYKFSVTELSEALEEKKVKSAFNVDMPAAATAAVSSVLKRPSLGFDCTSDGKVKLIAKFRLLSGDANELSAVPEPYAVQREYRAGYLYEPATDAHPARIVVDGVRLELLPVDKYSVVTPGEIGFRVRQTVQVWDSSTADGSVHPDALVVARRVREYLTDNMAVIAQLADQARGDAGTCAAATKATAKAMADLTFPALDEALMASCFSMAIRLKVVSRYIRGATAVSVTRVTTAVSQYHRKCPAHLQQTRTEVKDGTGRFLLHHKPPPVNTQITARHLGYHDLPSAGTNTSDAEDAIAGFMRFLELLAAQATKAMAADGSFYPAA